MCVCAWGLWEYECLHFLSVQCVFICIHVMPHSKCLHPTSEAQRCEEILTKDKKDVYKRELLLPAPASLVWMFLFWRTLTNCQSCVPDLCHFFLPDSHKATLRKENISMHNLWLLPLTFPMAGRQSGYCFWGYCLYLYFVAALWTRFQLNSREFTSVPLCSNNDIDDATFFFSCRPVSHFNLNIKEIIWFIWIELLGAWKTYLTHLYMPSDTPHVRI